MFAGILARFGAPEAVLTDNGKVFTGRYACRPMEVTDRLLEVWSGDELLKTVVRHTDKEVRKKRAERTARTLT